MANKTGYRFKYVGATPSATGLVVIKKGRKSEADEAGMLYPNDEVVVDDPDVAGWLRSLTDFQEVASPTSDKATHKRKAPKKPAA